MPAPGDQHRETAATANPFGENLPRINEYTAQEIATLQNRLDKQLGPEYISARPGAGGGKVHYIAAEKVINLANEVFGFNGWSSQIQNVQIDFVDENPNTGKISLGLSTIVRVTLKDGTFHEDIGYGQIENCKGKAPAFEKAKKEAATDAMKRALRNFGNVLGNCLYDKDYLARITKIKPPASKWDAENLHRHPDFAPAKKDESKQDKEQVVNDVPNGPPAILADFEDEFGGDLFGEVEIVSGYPDEAVVPQNRPQTPKPPQARSVSGPIPRQNNAQSRPPVSGSNVPMGSSNNLNGSVNDSKPILPDAKTNPSAFTTSNPSTGTSAPLPNPNLNQPQPSKGSSNSTPPNQPPNHHGQPSRIHEPPVGFITSRAAEALTGPAQPGSHLADLPRFNPNAESPSIRKTSGVNHSTSAPVKKANLGGGAAITTQGSPSNNTNSTASHMGPPAKPTTANIINPSESAQRKIGAPSPSTASPLANRSAYKPPSAVQAGIKRPFVPSGAEAASTTRPPLADVSNVSGQASAGVVNEATGEEAKRPRMADS